MDWKLSQIRYAVAVADAGGFTAAAARLGVRQPTVSNGVSRLEEILGAPLFARTSRRICLTPLGEALLPRLRALLVAEQDLLEGLEGFRVPERAMVRIGISPIVDATRLLASCSSWCGDRPKIELVLKECSIDDMSRRLAEQSVDLVIGVDLARRAGQGRCVLYEEILRYAPRGGLPASGGPSGVTLSEIAREPVVLSEGYCGLRGATLRLFEAEGIAPTLYPGNAYSYPALVEWAELGLGGALIPGGRFPDRGERYPVLLDGTGHPTALSVEAVWRRDALFRPHVAAFVQHLQGVVPRVLQRARADRGRSGDAGATPEAP